MYEEPKMEKLTINLPPMDLARIDILVEGGYYPSRTDFIRDAIRNRLETHDDFITKQIKQITTPIEDVTDDDKIMQVFCLGVYSLDKETLDRINDEGKLMKIQVVGMLRISKDVKPKDIEATIASLRVRGVIRASSKVKQALQKIMEQETGA